MYDPFELAGYFLCCVGVGFVVGSVVIAVGCQMMEW